jgi:pSer/pThr/pTyr-binding forkhead associated (FHA) protein
LRIVATGKVFELDRSPLVIGRDESSAICINDANVSRTHAQLSQDATGIWKLNDLGSTNGTLLNERPCEQALLRDGDLLTIGTTVLAFEDRR